MKTQNIKGKLLSNQIATRKKKAGQVELERKLDANVRVTNFRVLFAAYRARVQGPLNMNSHLYNIFKDLTLQNCTLNIENSVLKVPKLNRLNYYS